MLCAAGSARDIGTGAALARVVTAVPQPFGFPKHKIPLFAFAGLMLVLSGVQLTQSQRALSR